MAVQARADLQSFEATHAAVLRQWTNNHAQRPSLLEDPELQPVLSQWIEYRKRYEQLLQGKDVAQFGRPQQAGPAALGKPSGISPDHHPQTSAAEQQQEPHGTRGSALRCCQWRGAGAYMQTHASVGTWGWALSRLKWPGEGFPFQLSVMLALLATLTLAELPSSDRPQP